METIFPEELKVRINSESNKSTQDERLVEEPWTNSNAQWFRQVIEECKLKSLAHGKKGRQFKKTYAAISIPLIFLPNALAIMSPYLTDYEFITISMLLLIAMQNTISTFYNFGSKMQANLNYEFLFIDLANI